MILRYKRRAQISTEYLIILAISMAVLIPAGYFFYVYSQSSNDEVVRQQVNQVGQEILENAESIYVLSDGALITIELRYPKNILGVYVLNYNDLVILYELGSGTNEAVFFSKIPISGPFALDYNPCTTPCENSTFYNLSVAPGKHSLKIESKTSYVKITQLT